MDIKDTGLLLNPHNIKLQRMYFKQMLALHGLNVLYRAPREETKTYDSRGELDTLYYEPMVVRCIYNEHPTQQTAKKMGWNAELGKGSILITVPYDTPKLQVGCLFEIPSGLDGAEARVFKVLKMETIAIYPADITCELGPMFKDELHNTEIKDFSKTNFNLVIEEEDEF